MFTLVSDFLLPLFYQNCATRYNITREAQATFPRLLPNKCFPAFSTRCKFPALFFMLPCIFLQVILSSAIFSVTPFPALFSQLHVPALVISCCFFPVVAACHTGSAVTILVQNFSLITLTKDKHLLASSCPALVSTTRPYSTE